MAGPPHSRPARQHGAPGARLGARQGPVRRRHHVDVDVSLNNYPTYHFRNQRHLCRYFLIPREDFQAIVPAGATRLVLENEQAVINRAAKKVFSRKKRQDLIHLLAELDGGLGAAAVEATDIIRALRRGSARKRRKPSRWPAPARIGGDGRPPETGEEQAAQEHVEKHAALLQTQAEERVAALRKELGLLEKRKDTVAEEVEGARDRLAGIDAELEAKRRKFDVSCQKEQEKLEGQGQSWTGSASY